MTSISFRVIQPQTRTSPSPAILIWAARQHAEVERILSRPTPSEHVIAEGEARRIAEIEMLLDDTNVTSYVRPAFSLMRIFN